GHLGFRPAGARRSRYAVWSIFAKRIVAVCGYAVWSILRNGVSWCGRFCETDSSGCGGMSPAAAPSKSPLIWSGFNIGGSLRILKAADNPALADHTPGTLRLGKTGERLGTEILDLEQRAYLPAGAVGNDQGARPGQSLQTGGEV